MKENTQQIKIAQSDKVNGFYTLLTNGSIVCLPDNEYIVPEYVLSELVKKGIKFKVKSKEKKNVCKASS